MQDEELKDIWNSCDQKLEEVLTLNKEIISNLTKDRLNKTVGTMKNPKRIALLIGFPYVLLLYFITFISFKAEAYFATIGFGAISIITNAIIFGYCYHLVLISQISHSEEVVTVQKKMAALKIASFNLARLSIIQLPFWSVCWISIEALKRAPFLYGGVNLLIFLVLSYFAYWLFKELNYDNVDSKVHQFFLSGVEWEPIIKAAEILEQLKEYKRL